MVETSWAVEVVTLEVVTLAEVGIISPKLRL